MKKGNPNKDPKSGKFLPSRSAEELVAGIGELNSVINLKRELKDCRNMFMKNMLGTLTSAKVGKDGLQLKNEDGTIKKFPYELSKDKLSALTKYIEMLMDKIAPNAKVVEGNRGARKIVIKR